MPRREEHSTDPDFDLAELSTNGQEPRNDGPDPFDLARLRLPLDPYTRMAATPHREPVNRLFYWALMHLVRVVPRLALRLARVVARVRSGGRGPAGPQTATATGRRRTARWPCA